jgi:cobalt-precorrin-5B (C1)-methyltransferase
MERSPSLRSGYTTGACATAATRGALLALIYQRHFSETTIPLPIGQHVTFVLHTCSYTPDEGRSSVIKDAGDDPDVTHLAEICARVTWHAEPGVHFVRGEGVGLVTKKGLPVPPGEPAINPVPRQMLTETVQEILAQAQLTPCGVVVEISVPHGAKLAQKTLNPRLGILDGISILGTTGIVVPYSTAAWEASVLQNIDVAVAQGCEQLVFTVGGRGERFAQRLVALPDIAFVQIGDFFGQAFRHAAATGAQHVTLASMIGKLAKFAAGHELVHSRESSQDFHFLGELARQAGAAEPLVQRTCDANTAQEVSELMSEAGVKTFHDLICRAAWEYAVSLMHGAYTLEVMLLGRAGEVLGSYGEKHGAQ